MSFKFFCTGVSLACLLVVSAGSVKAQVPTLTIDISPGPDSNSVTWDFGGSATREGFVFFNENGIFNPNEPGGTFFFEDTFTNVNAGGGSTVNVANGDTGTLQVQSGSAMLTLNGTTSASITGAYFDNGGTDLFGNNPLGVLGFVLDSDISDVSSEGDTFALSGSIIFTGAGIDAFTAGGDPLVIDSFAFGGETNLPLRLSISSVVIPEPSSACLLGLVGAGIAARRRRSRR